MKPGPGLFVAALVWLLLAAAAYIFSPFVIVWIYAGLVLVPLALVDFLVLYFLCDRPEVKREIPSILNQGRSVKVTLTISRSKPGSAAQKGGGFFFFLPMKILAFDMYPSSMTSSAFPARIPRTLFSGGRTSISFEYTVTAIERGPWFFRGTELLLSSLLRFWKLKVFCPCESSGKTFPDFFKIKAGADLRGLLEKTGVKNIRRRGQGMEFRSLRDYQEGDSVRDIDWRAVGRKRGMDGYAKLIVREYQDEQDQQILFLLDTGYRLNRQEPSRGGFEHGRSQFDSALEAVLLLSWVSLKHGDSVAAASFGGTSRWLFPGKGMSAFPRLMNGLYDLKSSTAPSSPFSCLEETLGKLKRRTFIILISNFREEDGESLSWILKRIEKRHLLLLVSLKENDADAIAARTPAGVNEALETAAAFSYLAARKELYQSWEHQGLLTLEASSQNLSPALINRYLQVKRSGRL